MNTDIIIEACAQAAYEAFRAHTIAETGEDQVHWENLSPLDRSNARDRAREILNGTGTAHQLTTSIIRVMAATLGGVVVYPPLPATQHAPAFAGDTVDWSAA